MQVLPKWYRGQGSTCQCRRYKRCGLDSWVEKFPWRMKWWPIRGFLSGKFLEQRSLVAYSPWGHKELDTAKHECKSCMQARRLRTLKCCKETLRKVMAPSKRLVKRCLLRHMLNNYLKWFPHLSNFFNLPKTTPTIIG